MTLIKKTLIALFLCVPMLSIGQVEYKSEEPGFSISFPTEPHKKVGTVTTDIMYEDEERGLLYAVSYKPYTGKILKGRKLRSYVKKQLTKETETVVESLADSQVAGIKSVRVSTKADYEHYQVYYKIEYLIIQGFEISVGIMSSEDQITFEALDNFIASLKFH